MDRVRSGDLGASDLTEIKKKKRNTSFPPTQKSTSKLGGLTSNGHFLDSRYIRGNVCREREERKRERGDKQQLQQNLATFLFDFFSLKAI